MFKNKLLQKYKSLKSIARDITLKGREITKQGQYLEDLVALNEDYVNLMENDSFLTESQWDQEIKTWALIDKNAKKMLSKLDETQSFAYAINSATMATSDTISVNVFSTWPLSTQKQARDIYNRYEKIIEQSDLIKKIEHEIIRLNLNSSWNTELTILELLQKSKNAFEIPSDPDVSASGVLIPLRESINQILSELLRNRPTQEAEGTSIKL